MTGNKLVDNILVGLSSIAVLFTAGVFIYTTMIFEKPLPDETKQMLALIKSGREQAFSEAIKLEQMTINLPTRTTRLRYLDLEVHLVPFFPDQGKTIDEQRPLIKDIIIDTAGHMEPEELNTAIGRMLLESRIKNRVNQNLGQQTVKDIYFSRFVIQ